MNALFVLNDFVGIENCSKENDWEMLGLIVWQGRENEREKISVNVQHLVNFSIAWGEKMRKREEISWERPYSHFSIQLGPKPYPSSFSLFAFKLSWTPKSQTTTNSLIPFTQTYTTWIQIQILSIVKRTWSCQISQSNHSLIFPKLFNTQKSMVIW